MIFPWHQQPQRSINPKPGKLRSEVPGGDKALVISKFDALSQKTDQLIPTLRLGNG